MKKIAFVLFIAGLTACSAKKEWTKEYVSTKCTKEATKRNEENKKMSDEQVKQFCDCMAGKMISKYKSEAEADKDPVGPGEIGTACAGEIMQ